MYVRMTLGSTDHLVTVCPTPYNSPLPVLFLASPCSLTRDQVRGVACHTWQTPELHGAQHHVRLP